MKNEKVIFCNIAWMKEYKGITVDDIPKNGGSFVKENNDCCECTNFLDLNHKCYGFIQNKGNSLHIERLDPKYKNKDIVKGVTVVWVATDSISCKIVGWYKNATMYRNFEETIAPVMGYDYLVYNFKADAKDCYLIPESDRKFVVPRASKNGKGKGLGQSSIWYAESSYAQNEFIPKVLDYIENYKGRFVDVEIKKSDLEKIAEDKGLDIDQLIDKLEGYHKRPVEAIGYINLAIKKEHSFRTLYERGCYLDYLGAYDEAIEQYKKALDEDNDNVDCLYALMNCYFYTERFSVAIEYGQKLLGLLEDSEFKYEVMVNLIDLYLLEYQDDKAIIAIHEYEKLNTEYCKDRIDNVKKNLGID